MDIEARRKFCGLLMFDVPNISSRSPTSRNNEITISSSREVDPSSLPYESRNIDHNSQFVIHDGFGEFSTSLAAGAASGDSNNQENLDTTDGDANAKTQPPKRTPRPPNAFILYRREKQPAIIASQRNLTNAEVSRTISDMWRKEPEEIRLEWERYADRKKLEHMQTYPNYVYRPNKNKSKVDKRRNQRKQTASKESNGNSIENKSTPIRRKSTKSNNVKPPTKLDLPLMNMAGFNMNQQTNSNPTNTSPTSYTTILPSPEMPLLTAHFDNGEFVSSHGPITPITPHTPLTPISTPPEHHDYKIQQNGLLELTYQQQQQHSQQHHQGNASQFPFQSISDLTSFPANPDHFLFVPDVAQQQQQMYAEMMLHHEPHHHLNPTATVPSSNPASTVQYYSNGSFTEMLGFEFQNFLGSVNQNVNGLDTSGQYLQ